MSEERTKEYSVKLDRKGVHAKKKEYTSIRVDPELWKEVKIEAIRQDIEVSELTERALRRELDFLQGKKP